MASNTVEDLSTLDHLDNEILLRYLEERYNQDEIYTYVGDILIALNPCLPLSLYGAQTRRKYRDLRVRGSQPPHVYWVADNAHRNLIETHLKQCIIVTGDSGAGKTETTKYALQHLIERVDKCSVPDLVDKLSRINPLIELFGNASTVFNRNSSRFGKLIELSYLPDGTLVGGKLQTFVLEKSRVVCHGLGDKNFHILHAMFAGMEESKLQYYFIEGAATYRILQESGAEPHNCSGTFRDAEEEKEFADKFQEGMSILSKVGFSDQEVYQLIQMLAAVLHIGNIEFQENEDTGGVAIVDEVYISNVMELLNLGEANSDSLISALISRPRIVMGEPIVSFKTMQQAEDGRDALAKELYNSLFNGIIDRVNHVLRPEQSSARDGHSLTIGILDISGFENLRINSFEQLLINMTNERLHQYFQQQIFEAERADYTRENVLSNDVTFNDNSDVLKLLFESPGVLSILEEEVAIPRANDKSLVSKMDKFLNNSPCYRKKRQTLMFGIIHYAGEVEYTAVDFLEKNKGTLSENLRDCFLPSENMFVKNYFTENFRYQNESGRESLRGSFRSRLEGRKIRGRLSSISEDKIGSKTNGNKLYDSVASQYKKSLKCLIDRISTAKPNFIKCIKPNVELTSGKFDRHLVNDQLISSGLLEVAKIRRDGYPIRIKIDVFRKRYHVVPKEMHLEEQDDKKVSEVIVQQCGVRDYKIGKSKIFLKQDGIDKIEKKIAVMLEAKKERQREEERRKRQVSYKRHEDNLDTISESGSMSSGYSTPSNGRTEKPPSYSALSDIGTDRDQKNSTTASSLPPKKASINPSEIEEQRPAYDSFRITERDVEESNVFEERALKIMRLSTYVLLFLGILGSGTASLLGVLMLTSGIRLDSSHKSELTTELLVAYSIPQGITFLVSSLKILFGRKDWPRVSYVFFALLLGAAQACGTGFLVFRVLPEYDTVSGITLMLACAQLPTLLNIHRQIFRRRKRKLKFFKRLFVATFSIIASLLQFGFNPVVYITEIFVPADSTSKNVVFLTVSIFLVSFGWCESFAGEDIDAICFNIPLKKWRQEISQSRDKTNFLECPLKVGIFFLCAYWLVPDVTFAFPLPVTYINTHIAVPNSTETTVVPTAVTQSFFVRYSLLLIQVLTGYMCSYLCGIACKIHMQRFSFCLSLLLVPILSISLTIWRCLGAQESVSILEGTVACPDNLSFDGLKGILSIAVVLFVSVVMLTLHVWFPSTERMAKLERLFCLPTWDGIFTAMNVLLRRKDDVLEKDTERKKFGSSRTKFEKKSRPMVNICATMWHETRQEMLQLLKSLFRLDRYYSQNVNAEKGFFVERDYFDMKIHVIFDDAFFTDPKTKQRMPNEYVQQLVECIDQASESIAKGRIVWNNHPKKFTTPYGARLEWTLPGGVPMFFHLKDKSKVRHRKRWSQILYLYYLLGYELMGVGNENDILNKKRSRHRVKTFTSILNKIPPHKIKQAYNSYILTLDGDVDFRPEAVKLLIDRMQKNDKVAAVCGRIHPVGSGPMVWYQQFEYAVGHWLQKAAEHVFGCVLCCPGCFSLFRFAALIDDNVVRMYTTPPSEARHYIQFEQGEDRWLCTLLLQQGWKIDYCAGADSWTFAPESFKEFFIQRRRWAPSTMANILDLLSSWNSTVKMNDNISTLFILYQFILMSSSILGPGTVALMIAGSYSSVFSINMYYALLLSLVPVIIFIGLCLKAKNDTQIMVAGLLSSVYSVVMVIVTVGMVLNMASESLLSPNVIFLVGLVVIFVTAGISHPKEIFCLVHGLLYYLTVPSTFIFLTIYFLCNLNVVSWGTREGPKRVDPDDEERKRQEEEQNNKKKKKGGKLLNALGLATLFKEAVSLIKQALGGLKEETKPDPKTEVEAAVVKQLKERRSTLPIPQPKPTAEPEPVRAEIDPGAWGEAEFLGTKKVQNIMKEEEEFWQYTIHKYLEPLKEDKEKQKQIKDDLTSLRNNVVFGYFLMNLLFMIAIFQLQLNEDQLSQFFILGEYEPLSLAFLSVFAIVLLTQFVGMLLHRWGTFLHLMSSTRIGLCTRNFEEEYAEVAFKEAGRLQTGDPEPDYIEDLDSDTEGGSSRGNTLRRYDDIPEEPPDYPNDDQSVILPATTVPREWVGNIPEPDYGGMEPDYTSNDYHDHERRGHRRYQNAYERNFSKRFETMRNKYQKRYQRRMSQVNGMNNANISRREALYNRSLERGMKHRQSLFPRP